MTYQNLKLFSSQIKKDKKGLFYLKGSSHRVKLPTLDVDFALFLGLLCGDGWMVKREIALKKGQWRIGLVEDDKPLIDKFVLLVEKLFLIKPHVHFRKTKYEVYFNSRIVYELLTKIFRFPDGEKKGKLKISKNIFQSEPLLINFLKGIFSTDGKFLLYNNYPRVGLDSATFQLINDTKRALKRLGFNPKTYIWNRKEGNKLFGLYLNGKKEVRLFYQKINFLGEKEQSLKQYISTVY